MRLRERLFLFSFLAIVGGMSVSLLFLDSIAYRALFDSLRAKALSIASTAALSLDGDALGKILEVKSESAPEYQEVVRQLRAIRDANRREDTHIQYIYALAPDPLDHTVPIFLADAEESERDRSRPGEAYRKGGEPVRFSEHYSETEIFSDQWGTWVSAYAPVLNKQGKVVAALAVDIPADRLKEVGAPLLMGLLAASAVGLVLAFLIASYFSRRIAVPLSTLRTVANAIGDGDLNARANLRTKDEFGDLARALNEMAVKIGERDRVKSAFARYVSQQVLDKVLTPDGAPTLAGKRRRVTVMFCDIRGFTHLAEKLRPEQTVELLNDYFDVVVDIVFRYSGTLDKFLGDGLMAIFGAPADDEQQEEHAIAAAIEIRSAVQQLSQRWIERFGVPITIGIGIHSGSAIVGNIGSSKRMEYTAIGDTVNLASRLESATKEHGIDLIISEHTYYSAKGRFAFRSLGSITVRGREDSIGIFTVDP